jgi:hypothetical protein
VIAQAIKLRAALDALFHRAPSPFLVHLEVEIADLKEHRQRIETELSITRLRLEAALKPPPPVVEFSGPPKVPAQVSRWETYKAEQMKAEAEAIQAQQASPQQAASQQRAVAQEKKA